MLSARGAAPSTSRRSCHLRTHSNWCPQELSNSKCSGSNSSSTSSSNNSKTQVSRTSRWVIKTTVSCSNNRTITINNNRCRSMEAQAQSLSLDRTQAGSTRQDGVSHTVVAETSRKFHLAMLISRAARQRQSYLRASYLRVKKTSSLARFSSRSKSTVKPLKCSQRVSIWIRQTLTPCSTELYLI